MAAARLSCLNILCEAFSSWIRWNSLKLFRWIFRRICRRKKQKKTKFFRWLRLYRWLAVNTIEFSFDSWGVSWIKQLWECVWGHISKVFYIESFKLNGWISKKVIQSSSELFYFQFPLYSHPLIWSPHQTIWSLDGWAGWCCSYIVLMFLVAFVPL